MPHTPRSAPRDTGTPTVHLSDESVAHLADEICRAGQGATPDARFIEAPCRIWERGASYFALWSTVIGDSAVVALTPDFSSARGFVSTPSCEAPGWYTVSAWGRSLIVNSANSREPASESELLGAPQQSRARLRVKWNNASGGTFRDITIGGGVEIAVYGCGVTVEVLAPPQAKWGPTTPGGDGVPVPSFPSGVSVTESVGVQVLKGTSPHGFKVATLVDTVITAGGIGALIEVPPGAQYVTLSQPGGAGLLNANFIFQTTSAFIEPVLMDAAVRFTRVRVPSHATSLAITGADSVILTALWELDV